MVTLLLFLCVLASFGKEEEEEKLVIDKFGRICSVAEEIKNVYFYEGPKGIPYEESVDFRIKALEKRVQELEEVNANRVRIKV